LFGEDATLADSVKWLQELKFKALEKREGAAEQLDQVIELLNDDLLPDGAQIVEVGSQGVFVEARGVKLELGQLSDGYRGALALLVDLLRHIFSAYGTFDFERRDGRLVSTASAVVLIDEVEAHLHVSWQQKIGFWLTERFPKVQFLVTTHSPFICQAAHPEGLFLLPAPGEDRGVLPANKATYNQVVNGSIDDAVLSKLFGLEHAKSHRTRALEKEWASLRMRGLRGKLSQEELERKRELEEALPFPFEGVAEGR
jgi:predicted ATP-binding protein involved in virulence